MYHLIWLSKGSNDHRFETHQDQRIPTFQSWDFFSAVFLIQGGKTPSICNKFSMVVSGSPKRWYVAYNPPETTIDILMFFFQKNPSKLDLKGKQDVS